MTKSADAFRTISEVAEWLDTPTHVLRFWESKFPQLKPVKRAGGRRYYRPSDMELLAGIKKLLHEDGVTIRGVQKILREEGVRHVVALGDRPVAPEDDAPAAAPAQATVVPLRPVADTPAPRAAKPAAPPPPDPEPVTNIFADLDDDDQAPMLFADLPKDAPRRPAEPAVKLPGASPGFLSGVPTAASQLRKIPASELRDKAETLRGPVAQLRGLRDRIASSLAAAGAGPSHRD